MKKAVVILVTIAALMVAPVMALAQGPGEGGPIIEGNFGGSVNFGAMNPLRNNDTATNEYTNLLFPSIIGASPYTQDFARVGEEGVEERGARRGELRQPGKPAVLTEPADVQFAVGDPDARLQAHLVHQ